MRSACGIGVAIRTVPGLTEYVESERAFLLERTANVVYAYRTGDVSDEESHRFAGTLENAAPYLFTFIGHPGMEGTTNRREGEIRGRIVRPRNIQRILPNWRAARSLAVLQTIHATCAKQKIFSGGAIAADNGSFNLFGSGIPLPIFPFMR